MPNTIPVFINGSAVQAAPGASLAGCLAAHDPDLHVLLLGGAVATDARGLPVDAEAPMVAGAIYRLQRSARMGEGYDA